MKSLIMTRWRKHWTRVALSMPSRDVPQLIVSVAVVGLATYYVRENDIEPGSPLGYALGILGTALMFGFLLTYSVRKRTLRVKKVTVGAVRQVHVFLLFKLLAGKLLERRSMKWLLDMHIFMGLLGPALVVAHTGLRFQGLAGASTLLMFVVVASGFVGRYIYRQIPDAAVEAGLRQREESKENAMKTASEEEIERLEREIRELRLRLAAIRRAKGIFGRWRAMHMPLTSLFFTTVLIHIIAVLYY